MSEEIKTELPTLSSEGSPEVAEAQKTVSDLATQTKDPIEAASLNFGLYFPEFRRRVYKLSRKSAIRLLVSIVGHPLESFLPNMKRDDEKQAFAIAQSLADSKLVLILDSLYKRNQELAKVTAPPTEQEIIDHELERARLERENQVQEHDLAAQQIMEENKELFQDLEKGDTHET